MTTYNFSALVNDQHLAFNPAQDILNFNSAAILASAVQITVSGANLGFSFGGKTVWLDATPVTKLTLINVTFASESILAIGDLTLDPLADWYSADFTGLPGTGNQIWGFGGGDFLPGSSGADKLVGNVPLDPLAHVSSLTGVGSPTNSVSPSISADGSLVGFAGGWIGFGSASNGASDVFVKDMAASTVSNEHKSAAGILGNGAGGAPVISADGRAFAFHSGSTNLVDGPASGATSDIYVADVRGTSIERASTGIGGVLAADGRSRNADISADGRYVAFESTTSNWAAGGSTATSDIFMRDRVNGTLTRLSTSTTGGDGNGDSINAKVSAYGLVAVFESAASNLTTNDSNGVTDIFYWDSSNGTLTNLSDFDPLGLPNPNNSSNRPDVAFDSDLGGVIVFETAKRLGAQDTGTNIDIYAYSLTDGTFELVSSKADGSAVQLASSDAAVSGDGRFVVFRSFANDLVANDTNSASDIFVKDLLSGAIALVSKTDTGVAANQHNFNPEISLGGEWIVFESNASNLAASDANGAGTDVFRVANPLLLDTLVGGAGDDVYVISRPDIIQEQPGGGVDTVQSSLSYGLDDTDGSGALGGNVENLTLTGSGNLNGTGSGLANTLIGNSGNNTLDGGGNNDTLIGSAGNDTLIGGAGVDTASYVNADGAVTISLATGIASDGQGGNDTLIEIENLIGSAFNDNFSGNNTANAFTGGGGIDTVNFAGAFRLSVLTGSPANSATFTGPEGADNLLSVETLKFIDGLKSYDAASSVWQMQRLYGSAFDRVADPLGLNFHSSRLDGGTALSTVAQDFANSAEFLSTYGSLNNNQFVSQLYLNVLNRLADAGGLAYWSGQLNSGALTRGEVLAGFSESAENIAIYAPQQALGQWDIDESAAMVARLYRSAFDRAPDLSGLGYWTGQLKSGAQTLTQEAGTFVTSPEFVAAYGSLNNGQFVSQLYLNVLDRPADAGGLSYWSGQLNSGAMTRAEVLVGFSESAEHIINTIGVIDNGIVLL